APAGSSPAPSRASLTRLVGPCGAPPAPFSRVQLLDLCLAERRRLADEHGAPVLEREHEVGLGERRTWIVAGQHARTPRRATDQRLDELRRGWIEVGARLVEQQKP